MCIPTDDYESMKWLTKYKESIWLLKILFLIAYAIRFAEYRDVLRQLKKDGCLYEQDDFNNLLQKLDASTKKK